MAISARSPTVFSSRGRNGQAISICGPGWQVSSPPIRLRRRGSWRGRRSARAAASFRRWRPRHGRLFLPDPDQRQRGRFQSGFFPANYPETWLRLKRAGNVFTALRQLRWPGLGPAEQHDPRTFRATVYFGLAVSSRSRRGWPRRHFATSAPRAGPRLLTYAPRGESLGPSSRQTPLVFSEIMYHPKERTDGLDGRVHRTVQRRSDRAGPERPPDLRGGGVMPSRTVMCCRREGFAVIARNPAEFATVSGIKSALGPFLNTGGLPQRRGHRAVCSIRRTRFSSR